MALRKQQSKRRKGRMAAVAAAKKRAESNCVDLNLNPNLNLSQEASAVPTTTMAHDVSPGNKRPMSGASNGDHLVRCTKIRRRSSHHSHPRHVVHGARLLVPAAPLPLAIYQPASLFAMLLVASLLPKNTFSLRWLALSGVDGAGGKNCLAVNSGCRRFAQQSEKITSSLLAMALDPDTLPSDEVKVEKASDLGERGNRKALWDEAVSALEETISATASTSAALSGGNQNQEWSIDSVLDKFPRGGDIGSHEKTYAGLVNLGNTCYLNAQLQCAYHVPYLRQLILNAEDEVVDVEVEVEVEVEDDEEKKDEGGDEVEEDLAPDSDDAEQAKTETTTIETEDETEPQEEDAVSDSAAVPQPKKTIIKKQIKQEVKPMSDALRTLQHTFNTLARSSSGSTNVLCRALGINPYMQQDGQEFWKLFVPEVDHSEMAELYSGYFEDYVREIVSEDSDDEEELVAEDEYDEEEKKEDDVAGMSSRKEVRERVRTEPFLDLSIPVAEGTGGSVEFTLQEMFTEPEILRVSEGNGWRPAKGAEKVDAYKGSSLKREGLPSLLQLHLKRFKYDWETGETSKINDCCSFPLELDLSEISEEDSTEDDAQGDAIYDLQSIVIHKGEYGSGHYYSYVRPDIRSNDWYRFDDEVVTPVDYSDVVADAYGGNRRTRRRASRSDHIEPIEMPVKHRMGIFQRIFSLFGLFRRVRMIGSNSSSGGGGFGYGGRSSNAYMLQYARRSDIPKLFLEEYD